MGPQTWICEEDNGYRKSDKHRMPWIHIRGVGDEGVLSLGFALEF